MTKNCYIQTRDANDNKERKHEQIKRARFFIQTECQMANTFRKIPYHSGIGIIYFDKQ